MRLTLLGLLATFLTAIGLHPTVQGTWWFWASVICSCAAVAGCTLARLVGLPRPLVPFVGFLALVLSLTQLSVRQYAVLGLFPGEGAVRQYVHLMHKAFHYINVSVPPAPNKASLVALIAGGVGLIALLVDTCAVTYRASALSGLPLLALYGVPVSVVRDGVPWPYFALGAIGWLILVLAEGHERVGSWGRTIRRSAEEPRTGRVVGRRIGAAALGLAILVPAFLPGIGDGVLDADKGSGSGGGGRVLTVNPFVSLAASLNQPANAVVLDYKTTTSDPGYITLVTLDSFDGTTWVPSSLTSSGRVGTHQLPQLTTPAGVPQEQVRTTLHADGLEKSTWLPTPTTLLSVDTSGKWVYDDTHRIPWSSSASIKDLTYQATSVQITPTPANLTKAPAPSSAILDKYTALPLGIDPGVKQLAESLTKNDTTALAKAQDLQTYFRENFFYDASYRSPKDDPIGAFLNARRGFCQQFAGTFAVMARQLGLPTRVVVGFLPGHQDADNNGDAQWTVFWRDTHAWPEVYFTGIGWVRFEPTPRADDNAIQIPNYSLGSASALPAGSVSIPFSSGTGNTKDQVTKGSTTSTSGHAWWSPGHLLGHLPWAWFGGTLLVLVLLTAPGVARRLLRRRRLDRAAEGDPIEAALAAWQELEATCVDLGVDWPLSRTPRQTALALTPAVDDTAGLALTRLGVATERAQYARTPTPVDGLDIDVTLVRTALLERRTTGQRVRADVLPRSVLSRVAASLADTLDRADDLMSRRPWRRK